MLIVSVGALAIIYHGTYASVLANGLAERLVAAAVAIVAFCACFAVAAIAVTLLDDRRWIVGTLAAVWAASGLLMGFTVFTALGMLVEFAAVALYAMTLKREIHGRLQFSIGKIVMLGGSFAITLSLLSVSLYAYHTLNRSVASGRLQSTVVDAGTSGFVRALPIVVKEYHPLMTVDELILTQLPTPSDLIRDMKLTTIPVGTRDELTRRLSASGIDPDKIDLDAVLAANAAKEQELARQIDLKFKVLSGDIVAETRQRLSDSLGVEIMGDDTVRTAVRTVLLRRIERFTVPQLQYVPLILTLSLFLTLALFSWILTGVTIIIAHLLFTMAVHSGMSERIETMTPAVRYRIAREKASA